MELQDRPILKIKRSWIEIVLDIIGVLSFLSICAYCIYTWSSLPDQVPMHYNAKGEIDGWGGRASILIMPFIGVFLWIGLGVLERFPHIHNYSGLTEGNAERLYKNSSMMVNVLKNEVVITFAYFTWKSIQDAYGNPLYNGVWELPIFLVIIFGSMAFFIIRWFRLR